MPTAAAPCSPRRTPSPRPPGPPGGPPVVVQQSSPLRPEGSPGPGPRRRARAASVGRLSPGRPRTSSMALRTRLAVRQACCEHLGLRRGRAARPPRRRPAPAASGWSAGPAARAPCRSCSSCTVHSTSARPPGPSLVCIAGSAPRGSRSASTRALMRRISRTSPRRGRPPGSAAGRPAPTNRSPRSASPASGVGAQQRLALPDVRPALVVGGVRREGAHQRALPALGPQVGVDVERRVRRRAAASSRRSSFDHGVRRLRRRLLVGAVHGVVDEQHVGVAAVAQLVSAEPAHRHDREPGRQVAAAGGGHRPQGGVQRRLQGRGGDVGERLLDLLHARDVQQVGGRDRA